MRLGMNGKLAVIMLLACLGLANNTITYAAKHKKTVHILPTEIDIGTKQIYETTTVQATLTNVD